MNRVWVMCAAMSSLAGLPIEWHSSKDKDHGETRKTASISWKLCARDASRAFLASRGLLLKLKFGVEMI